MMNTIVEQNTFSRWGGVLLSSMLLLGTMSAWGQGQVLSGIDALARQVPPSLVGLKVALITNRSGITSDGSRTLDVVARQCQLVKIFAPEHGLEGLVPGGDYVPDGKDASSGIPVYSLYGRTQRPSTEMLEGLDALIYDIQDAGNRAYTYISTMFNCMEEAAKHNLKFYVLDRPNPLGGNRVEGNVLDPKFKSFVGAAPIPYVYGLTPGELARWYNQRFQLNCDLTVIPLKNWDRRMTIADTGLPWMPLSPNVPYPRTPMYLVITGLVGELQMVSEGLGTDDPFAYFGAPWFEPEKFTQALNRYELPGVTVTEANFTPKVGTHKDTKCKGVHIKIDPNQTNLFDTATALMECLVAVYPNKNVFVEAQSQRRRMFDLVCGTDEIRKHLVNHGNINRLQNAFQQQRQEWVEEVVRCGILIYHQGNETFVSAQQ